MKYPSLMKQKVHEFREEFSARDIGGILLGCLILALAIQGILVPAHLLTGGITGVAIILNYLTGLPIWAWYAVLNIPIFIAGYKYVSRRFIVYSIIGTAALSLFLGVIPPLTSQLDNTLLSAIFGGVVAGLGTGIIFRSKGSSGGLDIVAIVVRRLWGYDLGETFFATHLLVLAASLLITNLELTLFSAISIFLSSQVMDTVEAGLQVNRTAMIISGKHIDIADAILDTLHRGCTFLPARGAYSGEEKALIMVTVGKTQLPRLKEIVFKLDPGAFITVSETIEVYGQRFKKGLPDF